MEETPIAKQTSDVLDTPHSENENDHDHCITTHELGDDINGIDLSFPKEGIKDKIV